MKRCYACSRVEISPDQWVSKKVGPEVQIVYVYCPLCQERIRGEIIDNKKILKHSDGSK